MSCRRVEVLVRSGEVVVVLDSAEELRVLLDRMPAEAVEVDRQPPKAASGSTAEDAGAQVCVPFEVWARLRSVVSEAEGIFRAWLGGGFGTRRDLQQWLADVEDLRRVWSQPGAVSVSSQAAEA
jgi:hypothetical protein